MSPLTVEELKQARESGKSVRYHSDFHRTDDKTYTIVDITKMGENYAVGLRCEDCNCSKCTKGFVPMLHMQFIKPDGFSTAIKGVSKVNGRQSITERLPNPTFVFAE